MGLLPLTYRRPVYVNNLATDSSSNVSDSGDEKQSSTSESLRSGKSGTLPGIPESLTFDKIISGGTCPVGNAVLVLSKLFFLTDVAAMHCA